MDGPDELKGKLRGETYEIRKKSDGLEQRSPWGENKCRTSHGGAAKYLKSLVQTQLYHAS